MKDDPFDDVVILNCCGGLLLCRKRILDEYIVCNPTTKEFHNLPSPNVGSLDMSLAFDHSISSHYKLINVGIQFSSNPKDSLFYCLPIEIYSSDTNSWRRSRVQFPKAFLSYLGQCKGVFFNGAIFWIFKGVNSFCYFDIDKEILHSYQLPEMNEQYYCGCVRGNYIWLALQSVIHIILMSLYCKMTTLLGAQSIALIDVSQLHVQFEK
ncbi:hypothetical protein KY285_024262 [Solanum tuberosum]|nr:hypothetical protein KY285_024262 [Solanum tuberosum]